MLKLLLTAVVMVKLVGSPVVMERVYFYDPTPGVQIESGTIIVTVQPYPSE